MDKPTSIGSLPCLNFCPSEAMFKIQGFEKRFAGNILHPSTLHSHESLHLKTKQTLNPPFLRAKCYPLYLIVYYPPSTHKMSKQKSPSMAGLVNLKSYPSVLQINSHQGVSIAGKVEEEAGATPEAEEGKEAREIQMNILL